MLLCYVILCGFSRNQVVHKGVIPKVSTLAANIRHVSLEHYAAWSLKLWPITEAWIEPPQGWCKVNFDAVIREDYSTQAAVCKNLMVRSSKLFPKSTLPAIPCMEKHKQPS
jgi:hypothetical protein